MCLILLYTTSYVEHVLQYTLLAVTTVHNMTTVQKKVKT